MIVANHSVSPKLLTKVFVKSKVENNYKKEIRPVKLKLTINNEIKLENKCKKAKGKHLTKCSLLKTKHKTKSHTRTQIKKKDKQKTLTFIPFNSLNSITVINCC